MSVGIRNDGTQDMDRVNDQFLVQLGEDRGARIDIQSCSFKHSRFCRGLINYRRADKFDFSEEPSFFKFSNQGNHHGFRDSSTDYSDGRAEPYIRIKGSHFENLAYHQEIKVLSNLVSTDKIPTLETLKCGADTITSFIECIFPTYDHRGFVINAQGFPGTIQIDDSVFRGNMAYIKDYYLLENEAKDQYLSVDDLIYSDFEQRSGQLNFKICNKAYEREYLSQVLADPRDNFDDGEFAKNYETVTSIFIQTNQGPTVIRNNRFEENIGTMGGVISIMSPDFEGAATDDDGPNNPQNAPYTFIEGNVFWKNMAYFAGNAIYYAATIPATAVTESAESQALCGGGVIVHENTFENNIGLKKHNGGAIAFRCLRYHHTDGLFIANGQSSKIDFKSAFDSMTDVAHIVDKHNDSVLYQVYKF